MPSSPNKIGRPAQETLTRSAETQGEAESGKLGLIDGTRKCVLAVVNHPAYEVIQRAATYASIFFEPLYRCGCAQLGIPTDESLIDSIRIGTTGAFAANLAGKTYARGMSHFKEPEAWIDAISVLAETFHELPVGNARIARLIRRMKGARQVAKMMRVTKIGSTKQSLEEQSMTEISRSFSWFMMALLASMPLVADFKELDYSDPVNTAKEVGFAAGMVFFAKTFNSKIRKVINQNYTQLLEESRERVWKKLRENPELEFLKDRFSEADNEVLIIVDGLIDTLISLKGLINPVGEDLELNEDGEIQTKEIDAVVIITDLRNFTALSEVLGGDIFPFLKLNYFSYLKELISQHGGKILNHTGDGLVVYFTDRKGMSKEDAAIQCTKELNHLTNTINDIWQMTGKIDKKDHGTGIGLSKGQIRIGDALSLGMEKKDSLIFRIYEAQQKMLMQSCPWTSKLETALNRKSIASLVGIGCPINLAARLESTAKEFPEYNGFIDENMYNSLAPRYRLKYHPLKKMPLKGIGDVMVYGMKRGK